MKKTSPERAVKSINKAVQLLDSKIGIDSQFPDLGCTFRGLSQNEYEMATEKSVHAFVLKNQSTMPQIVLSKMSTLNPNAPAGIAPGINKVYIAVGNYLYLWGYNKRDEVAIHEEDSEIVGVSFVAPKADIFNDNIKKVMVIATKSSIKVVALAYEDGGALTLFETGMMVGASGVSFKKIYGTGEGRIFMLGDDGQVYELGYQREEGWFSGRCFKRIHTSSKSGFMIFGRNGGDTIVDLSISDDGKVMYQLTNKSEISVTSLVNENDKSNNGFNPIVKRSDIFNGARLLCPNSTLMDSQTFKIISLHPTTHIESARYQLVAITSTGCRLYFTHYKNGIQNHQQPPSNQPPDALELLHVRTPPPNEFQNGVCVSHPVYHNGVMVLVKENASVVDDVLVATNPDVGYLAKKTDANNDGLFEFCTTIQVSGKILSIVESSTAGSTSINELAAPLTAGARQYIVLTTNGLFFITKQRPIDMLQNLIVDAQVDTRSRVQDFTSFFDHFGRYNGCALCFGLLSTSNKLNGSENPNVSTTAVTPAVLQGAKELLDQFGQLEPLALNTQMDNTMVHDGLHGLLLFIYRVIRPIWDKTLIKETEKNGVKTYTSAHPISELRHTQETLRRLDTFLLNYVDTRIDSILNNIHEFVNYLSQAIVFFLYIFESDSTAILQGVKDESKKKLLTKTIKQLLTTFEGRQLAGEMATSLIDFEFKKYENTAYVIDILEQHCGEFCGSTDVILYKVSRDIYNNRGQTNKSVLNEAFVTLKKLAGEIPHDKLGEIARAFAEQGCVVYGIQLALACAKTRDPFMIGSTSTATPTTIDPRQEVFETQQQFYDIVFDLVKNSILYANSTKKQAITAAFEGSHDKNYHYYIYVKFIQNGLGQELIRGSPLYLEEFLSQEPVSYEHLNLLADYYRRNERYEDAARTFTHLARIPANISIERRIELLTTASVCAKSVTSPTKQYEMLELLQDIKNLQATAYEDQRRQISVHRQNI